MAGARGFGAAALIAALLMGNLPQAVVASESPSYSGLFFWAEPDSRFGPTRIESYQPPDAVFTDHYGTLETVRIWTHKPSSPGEWWTVEFGAPTGEPLAVGTYTNTRHPHQRSATVPALSLSGEGAGCNDYRGEFTVKELQRDGEGTLTRFAAAFKIMCFDSTRQGWAYGEVRYQSTLSWAGWQMSLGPYSRLVFGDVVVGQQSPPRDVVVSNTGAEPISVETELTGADADDFAVRDDDACLGVIQPGATCTFGVTFTPAEKVDSVALLRVTTNVLGSFQEVKLEGTGVHASPVLTITPDPDPAYVGDMVEISVTADPMPDGGTVYLFHGDSDDRINQLIGSAPIGGTHGHTVTFSQAFARNEGLKLKAYYFGTDAFDDSESAIVIRSQQHPPETWITTKPHSWSPSATGHFVFTHISSDPFYMPAERFECKLDQGSWHACSSPYTSGPLADGQHTLNIRGIDANDRVEPDPEFVTWRVDTTGPDVGIVLNGGQAVTNDPHVLVQLVAEDQSYPVDMRVYNRLELDENGLLDPNGAFQFQPRFEWNTTAQHRGGTLDDGWKTVYVQVSDLLGWWSAIESASILLDRGNPAVSQPSAQIVERRLGARIPVDVAWPAPADSLSGIDGRSMERKAGSADWEPVAAGSSAGVVGGAVTPDWLNAGTTYGYRQNAIDEANNVSPWSTVGMKAVLRQQNVKLVKRSTNWKSKSLRGASGKSVFRSSKAGAWIKTTFSGSAVGWVSTMGPNMGAARVYVDGVLVETVDLHRSTTSTREIVWSTAFASHGTHTVEIRVVGTAGRPSVDLDAFVILAKP